MAQKKRAIIPNTFTMSNMVFGFIAIIFASKGTPESIGIAGVLIFLASFFDFFDGATARALGVSSPIGVQLDSLADGIAYGIAPGFIAYQAFLRYLPEIGMGLNWGMLIAPLFPICATYRLAKFNNDERQQEEFYGLPTPANAFFIAFLPFAAHKLPFLDNFWVLLALTLIFSILLISEIPMFSLKFSNFKFKNNWVRYSFLFLSAILLGAFQLAAFPIIILFYIFASLIQFGLTKIIHQ